MTAAAAARRSRHRSDLPPGIYPRCGSFLVRIRRGGIEQTATLPTLEDALSWRARAVAAAEGKGVPPQATRPAAAAVTAPAGVVTIEQAARRLCRGMVDGSIRSRDGSPYKPGVTRKYERALRLDVLPRVGAALVSCFTHGDTQRLVDDIAAARSAEHARQALTALRVALRVCKRYGELDANPCDRVRVPVDAAGETPPRVLAPEEAERIVAAAYAEDAKLGRSLGGPFARLAFASGLRMGELLALQYGPHGLDLDAGVVRVRASLDRVRDEAGVFQRQPPKSKASRRDVPLSGEAVKAMREHRLATGRPGDGSSVFLRPDDGQWTPAAPYRAFLRAAKTAGIAEPLPNPHDARHAYATWMLGAGVSVHAVARLLGHGDAALVLKRYGHALPDELAGAADTLAMWLAARENVTGLSQDGAREATNPHG
jgi:integrase